MFLSAEEPVFFAVEVLVLLVSVACLDCLLLPVSTCCARRLPEKEVNKMVTHNRCLNRVLICRISG